MQDILGPAIVHPVQRIAVFVVDFLYLGSDRIYVPKHGLQALHPVGVQLRHIGGVLPVIEGGLHREHGQDLGPVRGGAVELDAVVVPGGLKLVQVVAEGRVHRAHGHGQGDRIGGCRLAGEEDAEGRGYQGPYHGYRRQDHHQHTSAQKAHEGTRHGGHGPDFGLPHLHGHIGGRFSGALCLRRRLPGGPFGSLLFRLLAQAGGGWVGPREPRLFLARGFRRHGGFVRWCSNVGLRPRLGPCRDHWGRLGHPATWGTRGRFGPGQIRHRGIWITWRGRYRPAPAAGVSG